MSVAVRSKNHDPIRSVLLVGANGRLIQGNAPLVGNAVSASGVTDYDVIQAISAGETLEPKAPDAHELGGNFTARHGRGI